MIKVPPQGLTLSQLVIDTDKDWGAHPIRMTPLGAPCGLTKAKAVGGALPAETYSWRIMAVTATGAEGCKSYQDSITITGGDVAAGIRQIDIGWTAIPGAASYHVWLWNSAMGSILTGRSYSTPTNSISITADPVSAPTGLAGVAGIAGGLRADVYAIWVTAIFADGETNYSNSSIPIYVAIPGATDGVGSIALTWNAVVGAIGYRVYIGREEFGNTRAAIFYLPSALNAVTYTGQALTFAYPFGNSDMEASGIGIFSNIRTIGNAKNIFSADIQISGAYGSEAVFQANRVLAGASLAGMDFRTNHIVLARLGLCNANNDLLFWCTGYSAADPNFWLENATGMFHIDHELQLGKYSGLWLEPPDADAGNTLVDSNIIRLTAKYWTGVASARAECVLWNDITATTPDYFFYMSKSPTSPPTIPMMRVRQNGSMIVWGYLQTFGSSPPYNELDSTAMSNIPAAATSIVPLRNSAPFRGVAKYWSGAASVSVNGDFYHEVVAVTPISQLAWDIGGIRILGVLQDAAALPGAAAGYGKTLAITRAGPGGPSIISICVLNSADAYEWVQIATST